MCLCVHSRSFFPGSRVFRVLIVGDNESGYGGEGGTMSLREGMLKELDGKLDLNRIHFLGRIPHPQLMAVLQRPAGFMLP